MELEFIAKNILNPEKLINGVIKEWKSCYNNQLFRQYDPALHDVYDTGKRPNKKIVLPDPSGLLDAQGNTRTNTTYEEVNRIALPIQQLIVKREAAFLTGGKVTLKAATTTEPEKSVYSKVQACWKNNKLQFKNGQIAKRIAAETECAEIWYAVVRDDKEIELRCNIYSPSDGYRLYPVFNDNKDLIAFGIGWSNQAQGTQHFDIYIQGLKVRFIESGKGWKQLSKTQTVYQKIPVIYWNRKEAAWTIVQPLIQRLETLLSNFADTNDYFGHPILFANGEIKGFASKGEQGKIIEGEGDGADLKYVTWEHAPESIKLEIDTLFNIIYTCTQTPDISFEQMKGLGDISGSAIQRIMIDAYLKAIDQQEGEFGECMQRRINFMQSAIIDIDGGLEEARYMDISPVFALFNINDLQEKVTVAMAGNGGKPVFTHEESIAIVGSSDNPEETAKKINAEAPKETAPAKI